MRSPRAHPRSSARARPLSFTLVHAHPLPSTPIQYSHPRPPTLVDDGFGRLVRVLTPDRGCGAAPLSTTTAREKCTRGVTRCRILKRRSSADVDRRLLHVHAVSSASSRSSSYVSETEDTLRNAYAMVRQAFSFVCRLVSYMLALRASGEHRPPIGKPPAPREGERHVLSTLLGQEVTRSDTRYSDGGRRP